MTDSTIWLLVWATLHVSVLARVLIVTGKEPASRAAWVLILLFLPGVGMLAYLLFGEPWMPRSIRAKAAAVVHQLEALVARNPEPVGLAQVPDRFVPAFRVCERLALAPASGCNDAVLAADSDAAIDAMVADFDAARETIHVSFYIWLTDSNGLKIVAALARAARRGITCRVIADGIGSRGLIRSRHWGAMRAAGVHVCVSLGVSWGLALVLGNRMDLRNHRKIVVVDDEVTWTGSQNCADPEFRPKRRYGPWIDVMLRFTGPLARQNQLLFASDWMVEAGEDLAPSLAAPACASTRDGFPAIAFGTGPLSPLGAMSNVFVSLLYAARDEVVITTPYFVPDQPLMDALMACARRGVDTTLILPRRNDSWLVAMISRAWYRPLVRAGVGIFEHGPGLLHAKTLVVDGEVVLVGSANMDRRSLDLNFENNVLLCSRRVAAMVRARQMEWLQDTRRVAPDEVLSRSLLRRAGDNLATLFGPVM